MVISQVWQTGHRWWWRRSACGDYASPDNWRTCYYYYLNLFKKWCGVVIRAANTCR